jgi:DNA polymerase-3 subunit epsilon
MGVRSSPIQIGVVRDVDGQVGRTNTSPVLPPPGSRTFERGAQRIHGLTPDYIAGAPEWPAILARLTRIATGPDGALLPLVAHNASFEKSVIIKTSEATRMPAPSFEFFDTLKYARQELPDAPNHRLNTLVDHLELGAFQHHDAGEDAAMTARLLLALAARR